MRGAALAVKAAIDPVLNVPKMLVSKWERSETRPSGLSLKLLALVDAKGIDAIR
jgi:putative transcriptional regulator